jgi:hypothetical protein
MIRIDEAGDVASIRINAHLHEQATIGGFIAAKLDSATQVSKRIAARGIADHALILAELRLEEERIFPGEGRSGGLERPLLHEIVSQLASLSGTLPCAFPN